MYCKNSEWFFPLWTRIPSSTFWSIMYNQWSIRKSKIKNCFSFMWTLQPAAYFPSWKGRPALVPGHWAPPCSLPILPVSSPARGSSPRVFRSSSWVSLAFPKERWASGLDKAEVDRSTRIFIFREWRRGGWWCLEVSLSGSTTPNVHTSVSEGMAGRWPWPSR